MKYLIIAIVMLANCSSAADLLVGQYAYHFHKQKNLKREFKREYPLIGYSNDKYTLIAMENSYEEFSLAALRTIKRDLSRHFRGAVSIGIASGYEQAPYDFNADGIIPVGYLSLDIHPQADKYGLVITYAYDEFIGAGLRFSF